MFYGSCGGCINYCPHFDICLSDQRTKSGDYQCMGREMSSVDCGYVCMTCPICARWVLAAGVHG